MTTPSDALRAAAVLRNAATLTDTAGWVTNAALDATTGALCLDGAIHAASTSRLTTDRFLSDLAGQTRFRLTRNNLNDDDVRARLTATLALAEPLPDTCTVKHADTYMPHSICHYSRSGDLRLAGVNRVHHYNDYLCTGGEEAKLLLVQAAEKLEAEL